MAIIKIGSPKDKKGITIEPMFTKFNGNNVNKIVKGDKTLWGKPTYIYRLGDECSDLTGGWASSGYTSSVSGYSIKTATKNERNMLIAGSSNALNVLGTQKAIDLTNYNNIYISIIDCNVASDYSATFEIRTDKTIVDRFTGFADLDKTGVIECDISNYDGLFYLSAYSFGTAGRNATIDKIWLTR